MAVKIAVIDDSEILNRWLEANLASSEFEVATQIDPLQAEEFIQRTQPDILLLDVLMPGLGGDALCKKLKSDPATRDMTIVFHSNVPKEILKDLVDECSADGYIVKTDDPAELARQVRYFLK